MNITEVIVCWTPNSTEYPSETRGKFAVFPLGAAEAKMAKFAHRSNPNDTRARDPDPIRQALYVMYILYRMTELDGLKISGYDLSRKIDAAGQKAAN